MSTTTTTGGTGQRVVLVSCGSFNPVTIMHLRMFELARDYLATPGPAGPGCQVLAGLISPTNDKYVTSKRLAPARDRCRMVELALQPLPGQDSHWVRVRLDDWESRQSEWCRTLTALNHFRQQFAANDPTVSVRLLCGADLFETFNVPDLWLDDDIRTICGDFGLIVITREGSDPWRTLDESPKSSILKQFKSNIHIIEEPITNSVSSSAVRAAIRRGHSIRYLVPDPVVDYIAQNDSLYKS